jgi:biotin carboxylase
VVQQKVSELIYARKLQKFDFLTHDEYSLAIVGKLRDAFNTGSPGFNQVNKFLTKTTMKEVLNDKIRIPKYVFFDYKEYIQNKEQYLNQIAQTLEFPIFAKPVDNAGACNTSKILSKEELVRWAEEHKSSSNFELDEFVNGTLYHIDSLIFNNKIIFSQVAKYAYPCFDFLQGKPVASIVVPDLDSESTEMKNFNKQVIKAISPVPNGGTHLEVFKKSNGELVFVEIAARTPGALVPQMYEKYYGFKIEELHFRLQMGKMPSVNSNKKYYSAWVAYPIQEGIVTALRSPTVKSQYDIIWKVKVGDKLSNPIELKDSALTILLWNDNYDVLREDFEYLTSTFKPFTVK